MSPFVVTLTVAATVALLAFAVWTWRGTRRTYGGMSRVTSIRQTGPGEWTADIEHQPAAPERRREEG